jgi:hypothetical protein
MWAWVKEAPEARGASQGGVSNNVARKERSGPYITKKRAGGGKERRSALPGIGLSRER